MTALLKDSKFNPLTPEEIEKYFSLIDMSKISTETADDLQKRLIVLAEFEPYLCSLIREKIEIGERIHITLTDADLKIIKETGADGISYGNTRNITFNPKSESSYVWLTSILYHEILHTDQTKKNLWLHSETREMVHSANKLNEAEAVCINYLTEQSFPFFEALKEKNITNIRNNLNQNKIPYADNIRDEDKPKASELYINTLAANQTIGQAIYLLMQSDGEETINAAKELGIVLTAFDLETLTQWRTAYNELSCDLDAEPAFSENDVGLSKRQQDEKNRLINYYTERYPELKNKDFFKTGTSIYDNLKYDINHNIPISTGTKTLLHANGQRAYTVTYDEKGLKNGTETYYDINGKPIFISQYKHGIIDGEQTQYGVNPESNELFIQTKKQYINGKISTQKIFNYDNKIISEIKYNFWEKEPEKAYQYTTFDERGNITEQYSMRNGTRVEKEILTYDEIKEISQLNNEGDIISSVGFIRGTNRKKSEIKAIDGNKEMYQKITYDSTGRVSGKGFILKDTFKPIGKWTDIGETTTIKYYTPNNDESDIPPIQQYIEQGYIQHPQNPNRYIKTGNGLTDNIYIDADSELIIEKGQTNQNDTKIGNWEYLRPDGSKKTEIKFSKTGKKIQTTEYTKDGHKKTKIIINPNNTVTKQIFWEDANNSIQSEHVYTNEKMNKLLQEKEFFADGQIKYTSSQSMISIHQSRNCDRVTDGLTVSLGDNLSKSFEYFSDLPNKIKNQTTTVNNISSTTYYRKDGTIRSKFNYDKDGNGVQIFYTPDKRIRATGSIKKYKKDGEWKYYSSTGTEKTCTYKEGIRTSDYKESEQKLSGVQLFWRNLTTLPNLKTTSLKTNTPKPNNIRSEQSDTTLIDTLNSVAIQINQTNLTEEENNSTSNQVHKNQSR